MFNISSFLAEMIQVVLLLVKVVLVKLWNPSGNDFDFHYIFLWYVNYTNLLWKQKGGHIVLFLNWKIFLLVHKV